MNRLPFKRILLVVIMLVMAVTGSTHAFAATYTNDDSFYNGNDILFYSKLFQSNCSSNSGGGQTTNDEGNIATAYNFFVNKGLSSIASAAIVGNLRQESGLQPTVQNSIGAYGIAQWLGDRKAKLQREANYSTLEVQLAYIWTELNGGYTGSLNILKDPGSLSASDLAVKFGEEYEGYGKGEEGSRGKYAQEIFAQYGGDGASTGLGSTCSNTGTANFTYFSQKDPKWAGTAYGSGTIGVDGCGPTSLAMIIATFFDSSVTPETIAKLGAANGSYEAGVGTLHQPLLSAASSKYGFTYTDMTNSDTNQLVSFIQQGGLIYMAGQGPAPFTTTGHIVVIRGVTKDGQFIIADPYRGETDTYDQSVIAAYRGTTYGITKS